MFIPSAGHRSLNTGLNGSTCPDDGDENAIRSQVATAVASFITTQGEEILTVDGVGTAVEALIGDPPTLVPSAELSDYNPLSVPFATSTVAILPPLPQDADYADALLEDF